VLQGRPFGPEALAQIQALLRQQSDWSRYRLSRELARLWNWRTPQGQLKDMAARTLLLKLQGRGWIELSPPRRKSPTRSGRAPVSVGPALHQHHYLGYRSRVGQNLPYWVGDKQGRPPGCLVFGAPAWQCAARDRWIGWEAAQRARQLGGIVNNTRFLIFAWVRVPHLASHVLGLVRRRLGRDWQQKYGPPIWWLETFVDRQRFAGTCYRAANWLCLGQTQGRGRQGPAGRLSTAIKDVYALPLHRHFRRYLNPVEPPPTPVPLQTHRPVLEHARRRGTPVLGNVLAQ